MAANTPFKKLVCQVCRQWKIDRTGKVKGEHCGAPMVLSENWYVRVTVRGQTTTKSVSPRKRDAEDYIANCKTAARRGDLLPGQERDVSWSKAKENAEQWWRDQVTKKKLKESSADTYINEMVPLDKYFKNKTLFTIRKGDVLDYQTYRAEEGINPTTINHEIKILKRIYLMHVERTDVDDAPKLCAKAADIGRVKMLPTSGAKVRFLDEVEIKLLLENAATPQVRMASLISLNTGLRRANVRDLTWEEVRLSNKVINLPADKMKGGKDHTVDIPAHLVPILKEWRQSNRLSPLVFPDWECDKCNNVGKKMKDRETTFRTQWDTTVASCGFDDVTFHTLRHTFASHFLMSGGDLSTLSEILDHSDISITKNIYGHLSRDHKRKATEEFAAAFLSKL